MSEEQNKAEEEAIKELSEEETAAEATVEEAEAEVAEAVEPEPEAVESEPEPEAVEPEPEVVEPEPEVVKPEPKPEVTAQVADAAAAAAEEAPAQAKKQLSQTAWIAISCAALVLGLLLGTFALGGSGLVGAKGDFNGKTAITQADLDKPIATMTFKGKAEAITPRDVIMENGSLEAAQDENGNYQVPTADAILAFARTHVMEMEAENRGLSATDEEVKAFAEENIGSSDYAAIGSNYGMDEQTVVDILRSSVVMQKLRDEVAPATPGLTAPEAPTEPAADADATAPTADYAAYIIKLVGSEWDAAKGTWASTDGPYATALANYEITADGATYEAAQVAYYVAYQMYSQEASAGSAAWTEFMNDLFSNCTIDMSTLVA